MHPPPKLNVAVRRCSKEGTQQYTPRGLYSIIGDVVRLIAGLEWHGELDGPSLLPLQPKAAEGRPGSGHQITPSIDAAFDAIDAKLQHLETADQPLER